MHSPDAADGKIDLGIDVAKLRAAEVQRLRGVKHQRLPDADLRDIGDHIRIRLAGWENGQRIDIGKDIAKFQRLEDHFVRWRDELDAASLIKTAEVDEHGLNAQQRAAIQKFHDEGGHVSRLPTAKIEFLARHGMVLLLELEVREKIFVTIGSICALSTTPITTEDSSDAIQRDSTHGLHALFPNYDFRDVPMPRSVKNLIIGHISKSLFLARSTVLGTLTEDAVQEDLGGQSLPEHLQGRELHRLGFASILKSVLFRVAAKLGSDDVLFNIGTVSQPKHWTRRLDAGNKPSTAHNDNWATPQTWRERYSDPLIPDLNVGMFWKVYGGSLREGIDRLAAIYKAKGHDPAIVDAAVNEVCDELTKDIAEGRHAPWLEPSVPTA